MKPVTMYPNSKLFKTEKEEIFQRLPTPEE